MCSAVSNDTADHRVHSCQQLSQSRSALMISAQQCLPSVPSTSAQQCHPSVPPRSAAHQYPAVLSVSATSQRCLSVPIIAAYQCIIISASSSMPTS
ncbi:unnamed protein product, partial [Staurois parvus]